MVIDIDPEFWDKYGTEVNTKMESYRMNYQEALKKIINRLDFKGNVLEIGSGNGALRGIYSGSDIRSWTHVEPNEYLANGLKSSYPGDKVIDSTLENANLGKYNTIVGLCSIHYLNDDEIKIACDSLSDGGRIIFLNDWYVDAKIAVDILRGKNEVVLEINNILKYIDYENMEWVYMDPVTCDETYINHMIEKLRENGIESKSRLITCTAFGDKQYPKPKEGEYKSGSYALDSVPDEIYEILMPEERLFVDANRNNPNIYLQVANVSCIEGCKEVK